MDRGVYLYPEISYRSNVSYERLSFRNFPFTPHNRRFTFTSHTLYQTTGFPEKLTLYENKLNF